MTTTSKQPLMDITPRPALPMVRGEGSRLWDSEGTEYLDFVQGWAVNCLGHCPGVIREALARQAALLISPSPAFHNAPQLALAAALVGRSVFDQVFFCNSGAEANEGAIKLARKWGKLRRGGAFEVITTLGAFHGRTLATMAASGKPGWDDIFPPRMEGFRKVPFGDAAAAAAAVTDRTAAIMVEPIQGEAGVVVPPVGYLAELRAVCDRAGILLIADEVQTGVGRTGTLFAYQQAGIAPDIMTLGKGLGGGVPLAALLAREAVCCFEHGDQGGTYNGNPLMTAVGLAVLETIAEPAFLEGVRTRGARLAAGLERLKLRHGAREVRGSGLLLALDLGREVAPEVVRRCRDRGLLVNGPRPHLLRLMPALNVSDADIDRMLAVLDSVLAELATG